MKNREAPLAESRLETGGAHVRGRVRLFVCPDTCARSFPLRFVKVLSFKQQHKVFVCERLRIKIIDL